MDRDLICFENGKTILNVNSIAMVFPDGDGSEGTYINCIGIQRTFHIKEKYEDVKSKLDNWLMKDPSNPKVVNGCKGWVANDEYCRCCSQDGTNPCFKK